MAIAFAGLTAVVAAESSWQGVTLRQFEKLGANLITVIGPPPEAKVKRRSMQADDALAIQKDCPAVELVAVQRGPVPLDVKAGRKHARLNAYQVSSDYLKLRGWKTDASGGRDASPNGCWLSPLAASMLLGDGYSMNLPPDVRVAGTTLQLNGIVVIPDDIDRAGEGYLLLPFDDKHLGFASASVEVLAISHDIQRAADQIDRTMSARVGAPTQVQFAQGPWRLAIESIRARRRLRFFTSIALALILLVSILGVTNTLLVSVGERVREIALRRALGSTTRRVGAVVFCESLLISISGLVLGFVFASATLNTIGIWLFQGQALPFLERGLRLSMSSPPHFVPHLSWGPLAISAVVALGAAVCAGYAPALVAVGIQPAQALGFPPYSRRPIGEALVLS